MTDKLAMLNLMFDYMRNTEQSPENQVASSVDRTVWSL